MSEWIERVPTHRVLVGHLAGVIVRHRVRVEHLGELLGRGRPHRVAVRVVGFPRDVVDTDLLAQLDSDRVADEASQEVLAEDLTRQTSAEVLQRPRAVHLEGAVDAIEEVRDPTGATLGQGDAHIRVRLQDPRPQQVGRGGLDVHRLKRDHHVGRAVGRGDREPPGRTEMDRQHGRGVATGAPDRIPVLVVEARVAERGRVLGEAQRVATLGRAPADLGCRLLGIPDRRHRHRDEATRIGRAPRVDVPVVVRLHERERQVEVVTQERPSGERRERREVHRRQHAAGIHVLDALVHVVAAGPHLVEALRLHAVLLLRAPGHRVERSRLHHERTEHPDVVALLVADEFGARSRYFAGRWSANRSGGSMMWSSTLIRTRSPASIISLPLRRMRFPNR